MNTAVAATAAPSEARNPQWVRIRGSERRSSLSCTSRNEPRKAAMMLGRAAAGAVGAVAFEREALSPLATGAPSASTVSSVRDACSAR